MQNILDIKIKLEEQARNEFAQAQLRVNEEEEKKQRLVDRQTLYEEEARRIRMEGTTARKLMENEQAIQIMSGLIMEQEQEINRALAALDKKRTALQEVMQERKMHEKLREKALQQYLEEEKAAESKTIDELTSYIYGRKSQDGQEDNNG